MSAETSRDGRNVRGRRRLWAARTADGRASFISGPILMSFILGPILIQGGGHPWGECAESAKKTRQGADGGLEDRIARRGGMFLTRSTDVRVPPLGWEPKPDESRIAHDPTKAFSTLQAAPDLDSPRQRLPKDLRRRGGRSEHWNHRSRRLDQRQVGNELTVNQKDASFVPSQTGATRINSSSGYGGWADCRSVEGAKDWLRQRQGSRL